MFNGVPNDQFNQFIASRTSLSIPLSPFPLHENPSFSAGFDPYRSSSHDEEFQQLQHQSQSLNTKISNNNEEKQHQLVDGTDKSMDPWSTNEVFLLLKVRSSMQNWYPDFSWEHVSRKLAELGYSRGAEQCKDKFEEESGNVSYNKNYRIFNELDEFYPAGNQEETRVSSGRMDTDQEIEKWNEEDREEMNVEKNSGNAAIPCEEMSEVVKKPPVRSNKKRKRKEKFEMLKRFCVAIVDKMMAQQEELHNKLIGDIVKRDEEIIAREEAWKSEEMERTTMEIEKWAQEQVIAGERQAVIIEFLEKYSEEQQLANQVENLGKVNNPPNSSTPVPDETALPVCNSFSRSKLVFIRKSKEQTDEAQHTNSRPIIQNQEIPAKPPSTDPTPTTNVATNNSSESNSFSNPVRFVSSSDYDDKKGDLGMRWPRDQVLALINLRCKFSNTDEGVNKGPLWERISQGMMELGYKRSAKRCKEKWENINKYYRKTKDSNKKRSVESRTCPYFHELSRLYSEGTLVVQTNEP